MSKKLINNNNSATFSLLQGPYLILKSSFQFLQASSDILPPAIKMTTTLLLLILLFVLGSFVDVAHCSSSSETKCWKRKYYVTLLGGGSSGRASIGLNTTVSCPQYYSWTISDYCCYDGYDRFDTRPFCCYSETYKLAVAVGLICLVLLGVSCSFFLCWVYNIPHYVLSLMTCGKFSLNDYMKKSMLNGPYVDPSFYTGEPFWSPANAQLQPYPLRPMPPGIFYPTGSIMKSRWSNQHLMSTGQMPLFIVASRQFTRNPYSARPNDRQSSVCSMSSYTGGGGGGGGIIAGGADSRRSSITSNYTNNNSKSNDNRIMPTLNFKVNIDEVEAAAELLESIKRLEAKDKNFDIPKLVEETQKDLDLLDEKETSLGSLGHFGGGGGGDENNHNSTNKGKGGKDKGGGGSRKNSITARLGSSSTKIVPIKSKRDKAASAVLERRNTYNNKIEKVDLEEDDEEEDEDDEDDDEYYEDSLSEFVVPVKTTVINELGQHSSIKYNRNHYESSSDMYALESVQVEDTKNKDMSKSDSTRKKKATGRSHQSAAIIGNTQFQSLTVATPPQEPPNKKNIPGFISE